MEKPNQTSEHQNPNSENEMKQISDRQTNKKKDPQRNRIRLYKPCHRESRMTWAPRMSPRGRCGGEGVALITLWAGLGRWGRALWAG